MSDSEKLSPAVSSSTFAQNGPNAQMPSVSPVGSAAVSNSNNSANNSQSGTASVAASVTLNGNSTNSHHHSHVYPSMYKDTTFTKIFVGGLPYHTTDKTLRDYFEVFGDIEEAVVITDRQTAKSRGYGFVTMLDRAAAERACKEPNPIIDGRKANVNLAYLGAKPRTNGIGTCQLDGVLTALQARAAAAGFNPFLQSPLGYPSPYLYPSPILISPNLFLSNAAGHTSPTNANGQNQNGSSATSPSPPANPGQSYYDFSTAAALAAAASSFVQQHHQFPQLSAAQYAGAFGDPSGSLYNFSPYGAPSLLSNGSYLHMNQTGGAPTTSSAANSAASNYASHLVAAQSLRGEK